MILVILLYIICAFMFIISKRALIYTEPIFFVGVRMLLAGILLGGYCLLKARITKTELLFDIKRDWLLFIQIIFLHIYLTYICDLCALKYLQSGESAFLYNLSPFITALFSYFWFGEKLTLKKWIGLIIGFIALMPLVAHAFIEQKKWVSVMPQLLTLIAVITSTYGWIIVRDLVKERGYSSIFVNGFGMFFAGVLALMTSFFTESWTPSPVSQWVPFIHETVLIVIVANIIFYNLYGFLLKRYTATFLSFAGFMCPLYTALLGWFYLAEAPNTSLLISFALVSVGLFIFYQEELRQGYIKQE